MSKKVDAIKDAVFYSKENPERLAKYIAGTIADVDTSVVVKGATSITVNSAETVTETYVGTVLSQFGDVISGKTITYTVSTKDGVSIASSTGVLSVTSSATEGEVTVTATCGSISGSIAVSIVTE